MTPHERDMSVWPEIRCQRHHEHRSRMVAVHLEQPHLYHDYPQIPSRLKHRPFSMMVWDPKAHPVDGGPYCPAHDAVSETILSHGIWEPRETILALAVLDGCSNAVVVDMGAQLGWFTLLALSAGATVEAWEADPDNIDLLETSAQENGWTPRLTVIHERIGPGTPVAPVDPPIRLAKLDLEGAEPDGIRVLWPAIEAGNVDHLMVELSPTFHDGYRELAERIIGVGYRAYSMPEKHQPPRPLGDDLEAELDGWYPAMLDPHQENIWFRRNGAAW